MTQEKSELQKLLEREELQPLLEELKAIHAKGKDFFKVVSFYIDKGGTGKTAHSYNYSKFCAEVLNYKVLVIDGDRSRNLTDRYGIEGDKTINSLFDGSDDFAIYKTENPNIDIIIGDEDFTDEGVRASEWGTKYREFDNWISRNYEFLESEYDMIVIDTHNDDSRVTYNLLVGDDVCVNVVSPDPDSYGALARFDKAVEDKIKPKTLIEQGRRQEPIQAFDVTRLILANNVIFNGLNVSKPTQEFLDDMKQREGYMGAIASRKTFVESNLERKSIFEIYSDTKNKSQGFDNYIANIIAIYLKITIEATKKSVEKNS